MSGRRKFMFVIGSGLVITSSGCGTVFHSERIGSPHSNQIDWKIAALDGLGLILFFVPGVVAFVVDFYSGAIYLPRQSSRSMAGHDPAGQPAMIAMQGDDSIEGADERVDAPKSKADFQRVALPSEPLTTERLESLLSKQLQQPVVLSSDETRVSTLESLEGFAKQQRAHRQNARFGVSLKNFFARAKKTVDRSRVS